MRVIRDSLGRDRHVSEAAPRLAEIAQEGDLASEMTFVHSCGRTHATPAALTVGAIGPFDCEGTALGLEITCWAMLVEDGPGRFLGITNRRDGLDRLSGFWDVVCDFEGLSR
jgi:hypothetical protein